MFRKLTLWVLASAMLTLFCSRLGSAQDDSKKQEKKDTSKKAGSTNLTAYNPNDVIAQTATIQELQTVPSGASSMFDRFVRYQNNGADLWSMVDSEQRDAIKDKNVIVIHAVSWKQSPGADQRRGQNNTYQPKAGAWAFYRISVPGPCASKKAVRSDYLKCVHFKQDHDLSGTPYLYNAPNIYFLDLNAFPHKVADAQTFNKNFNYQITTTPRQKQNASDFATLVSTLLKVSPAGATAAKHPPDVRYALVQVKANSPIPYDLAIKVTAGAQKDQGKEKKSTDQTGPGQSSANGPRQQDQMQDGSKGTDLAEQGRQTTKPSVQDEDEEDARSEGQIPPANNDGANSQIGDQNMDSNPSATGMQSTDGSQNSSAGQNPPTNNSGNAQNTGQSPGGDQASNQTKIACDPSPCSFSKTVTHYDPEYWDVSLGVSVPGVLEPKYTSTTSNGSTTYSLSSPTRHTDAYAFLDVYPFQGLAGAPTSLTEIPGNNLLD